MQLSFGLREKVGKGKLLGGGERVITAEPENFSNLGSSFGSGPNEPPNPLKTKHRDSTVGGVDFESIFVSPVLGLVTNGFDFLHFGETLLGLEIGRGRSEIEEE